MSKFTLKQNNKFVSDEEYNSMGEALHKICDTESKFGTIVELSLVEGWIDDSRTKVSFEVEIYNQTDSQLGYSTWYQIQETR